MERGLLVLEYLCAAPDSVRLVDIANDMDINKTTAFRILSTFQAMGYVEQDPRTEHYRPTLRVLSMGNAVLKRVEIGTVARPHIVELSRATGESVHLSVRNGFQVVIIDKVESDSESRASYHIGRSADCYSTGTGKVLLAHLDQAEQELFFETVQRVSHTPNTLTTRKALQEEFARIRAAGYAVDRQENVLGSSCVAAPIWNYTNKVVAGVSVTGPSFRIERRIETLAEQVMAAAAKTSHSLGRVVGMP